MKTQTKIEYACAVILIMSSITLAFLQVLDIKDVASGTLMYIAQAFLLAGSIFGISYYVAKFNSYINGNQQESNAGSAQ